MAKKFVRVRTIMFSDVEVEVPEGTTYPVGALDLMKTKVCDMTPEQLAEKSVQMTSEVVGYADTEEALEANY